MTVITGVLTGHVIGGLAGSNHPIVTGRTTALDLGVIDLLGRCPESGYVAGLANRRALDVARVLARGGHPVMTADAIPGDTHVVKVGRQPGIGCVAIIAGILACDVICGLASGGHAIVATGAGAPHFEMIHLGGGNPKGRAVTGLTVTGAADVTGVFAGCLYAVMTALAITCDSGMVKIRRGPGICRMTVVTRVLAGDVVGILARGNDAIVTTGAGTLHLKMIHPGYRHPEAGGMAGLTRCRTLNVAYILSCCGHTIVTGGAITHDTHVVKIRRDPGPGGVAVITGVAAGHVGGILARGNVPVVTGYTAAQDLGVVHPQCGNPESRHVASLADVGTLDVVRTLSG
jgi:hypothetical protein